MIFFSNKNSMRTIGDTIINILKMMLKFPAADS